MRISNIISDSSSQPKLKKIKDYAKVEEIFNAYLDQRYNYMAKEIFYYSDYWFFHDLIIYLTCNFKTESYKSGLLQGISDMYEEEREGILIMKQIKKLRKSYGL